MHVLGYWLPLQRHEKERTRRYSYFAVQRPRQCWVQSWREGDRAAAERDVGRCGGKPDLIIFVTDDDDKDLGQDDTRAEDDREAPSATSNRSNIRSLSAMR